MATKKKTFASHIIVDDRTEPTLTLRPGMRFAVHATTLVDATLKPSGKIAARLCGGTSTCIALIDLGSIEQEK